MNTAVKRAMVLFSVALNIGFISIAAYQFLDQPEKREDRRWQNMMVILDEMALPQSRKAEVIERLSDFRKNYKVLGRQIRQSRRDAMGVLAEPAPLDLDRLNELAENAQTLAQEKQKMLRAHVLELNRLLGDEQRARFYHQILENIKARYKKKR